MSYETITVAFTGHRPADLGGYNEENPTAMRVKIALDKAITMAIEKYGMIECITGGALGVDQWAAEICLSRGIPYYVYVPCQGQEKMWPPHAQTRYHRIVAGAKGVVQVYDGSYTSVCMQDRNEEMVDDSQILIAVWSGRTYGGTFNCVRYAKAVGRAILRIDPATGKMEMK